MGQPYRSLEAELHDAFWEAEDDASEVALMAAFLARHPGKALEMGAGSGRLMAPLLERGFDIEGVELSPDMIALSHRRGDATRRAIHHGDMTRWNDGRTFASVLAPSFTLQLAEDATGTLSHWHALLQPGGGLYLSVFIPMAELCGDLPENEWYSDHSARLADGRMGTLETRHQIDHDRQMLIRDHRYAIAGEAGVHASRQTLRWFEPEEMTLLFGQCGFRVERAFSDFDPSAAPALARTMGSAGVLTFEAVRNP